MYLPSLDALVLRFKSAVSVEFLQHGEAEGAGRGQSEHHGVVLSSQPHTEREHGQSCQHGKRR